MRALLRRADYGTPHGDQMGIGSTLAHAASIVYLSADSRYRRGFDMGKSSLPEIEGWSRYAWGMVPSSVAFPIGSYGVDLGWEPRFNFGETVSLVAPLRLRFSTLEDDDDDDTRTTRAIGGLGGEFRLKPSFLTSVRLDVVYWQRVGSQPPVPPEFLDKIGGGITTAMFGNKVRFTIESRPTTLNRSRAPIASVGIGDVNGILYWLLLRNKPH